jgi:hypothetical protein
MFVWVFLFSFGGGVVIYPMLCGENSVGSLEGYFSYFREGLIFLSEFFLGYD